MASVHENDSERLRTSAKRLAAHAMRLYRWRAALWCLTHSLLATLGLVALDYSLHVEEAGLRWLLSILWLGAIISIGYRYLPEALLFQLSPVRVAEWIERSRPELKGRLSNTLAILELPANDPRFGSASFRRSAIKLSPSELHSIEWQSYLDFKPTARAASLLSVLVLLSISLCAKFPPLAVRGLERILVPWHTAPWPSADDLRFVNLPPMIASGTELQIEVIDNRPPLPQAIELHTRVDDVDDAGQDGRIIRQPMRLLDGLAVVTIPEMRSNFSVRAVGGDDVDTQWHKILVADLPELVEHEFQIQPPAYSMQGETRLVGERIEILAGSRVTFRGRFNRRLRDVRAEAIQSASTASQTANNQRSDQAGMLAAADSGSTTTNASALKTNLPGESLSDSGDREEPTSWLGILDGERTAFELFNSTADSSLFQRDRRWQLHLTTEEGLFVADPKRWTIHVNPDRAPVVNLLPVEPLAVTREASVVVTGQATDDLGLLEICLVWQSDGTSEPGRRTLWKSHPPDAIDTEKNSGTPDDASRWIKQTAVNYQWRPDQERLTTGQSVSIFLEARDSLGQIARSVSHTVEISEAQVVLAQLQAQEAETFEPLRQLLESQRRNLQSLQRTRDVVQEAEQLDATQVDALTSARQLEQAIAQRIARAPDSVLRNLERLAEQLKRNGLAETTVASHVNELAEQIAQLSQGAIEPALVALDSAQDALRSAVEQPSVNAKDAALALLDKATGHQQNATNQLGRLVNSIATAETLTDLQKQFNELLAQQNALHADTQRLQVDRIANSSSSLADSKRIGLRSDQQSLARAVDDLTAKIDAHLRKSEGDLTTEVQPAANRESQRTLEQARQALVDRQVSQQMRNAADFVESERLTDAMTAQRSAAEALEMATKSFGDSADNSLATSSANLQDAAKRLASLIERQQQLAERFSEPEPAAGNSAPAMERQQTAVTQEARAMLQELKQSANERLNEALKQGHDEAQLASQQAGQEQFEQAAEHATAAAEKFRDAHANVEQRAAELEKQMAAQQLLDLRSSISDLARRQSTVVDKLQQLKRSRSPDTALANSESLELRNAAGLQEQTRLQLLRALEQSASLDTFAWLLTQCETDMARSVAALERLRLEPDALDSSQNALQKLQVSEQALKQTPVDPQSQQADPTAETQGEADKSNASERRPTLASLKLLRALQTIINVQTDALKASGADGSDPQFQRLADEQQALADQTQKIMQDLLQQSSVE